MLFDAIFLDVYLLRQEKVFLKCHARTAAIFLANLHRRAVGLGGAPRAAVRGAVGGAGAVRHLPQDEREDAWGVGDGTRLLKCQ